MVCEADIKKYLNSIQFQNQPQSYERLLDSYSQDISSSEPTIDDQGSIERRTNYSPSIKYRKYDFS